MPPGIQQASQINSTTGILTTGGDILTANDGRRWFLVQNLGTNPLFLKLGTGASSTSFNVILKAGTAADDGLGGAYESQTVVFTGIVSVAGTTPRFVISQI